VTKDLRNKMHHSKPVITCALETSWQQGSIALFSDEELLGAAFLDVGTRASANMTSCLQKFIGEISLTCADITRVVVSLGPGSFTGTRSGVAIAEGLAAAGCELVGVPFLFALAQGVDRRADSTQPVRNILVSIPANAQERFAAVYLKLDGVDAREMSHHRSCTSGSMCWVELLKPEAVAQSEVVQTMTRQLAESDAELPLEHLLSEQLLGEIVPAELIGRASFGKGSLVERPLDGSLIPEYVKRVRAKTLQERRLEYTSSQ
jgi:tRNA threonylcarbamoyl adenosine modification protein YeaZ